MSIRTLSRCGAALFFAALVSGCSVLDFGSDSGPRAGTASSSDGDGACRWNRSNCMHEGRYEPGERDYAEQEAKRLNQAQRSEEHTSELQSLMRISYAVFCLKKQKKNTAHKQTMR